MIGWRSAVFAFREQVLELGDRLRGARHADLRRKGLVVEDTSEAVVQAGGVQRSGSADAIGAHAILGELGGRPLGQPNAVA